MATIILTSQGFSNQNIIDKFLSFVPIPKEAKVAMVTTAARDKENNKWVVIAKDQFLKMGFETVDFIDIESNSNASFSLYDIIYVCGGNTFKLTHFSRLANFKKSIEELLNRGGIYIGLSASSLLMGPSIELANEVTPDVNEIGVTDFTGFGIIPQIIYPHYDPAVETDLQNFESRHNVKVHRLTNDQALILTNGQAELVG